jgi:hypothetical protein
MGGLPWHTSPWKSVAPELRERRHSMPPIRPARDGGPMTPMAVDVFAAGPGGPRPALLPGLPTLPAHLSTPHPPALGMEKKSMTAINFSPNYDSHRIEFIAKISYLSES